MKTRISKKKFYNKYDYKVTLFLEGCETLRYTSTKESKEFLENGTFPRFYISENQKVKITKNRKTLIDLCDLLLKHDADIWQKRIERNHIDIYSKNSALAEELKDAFPEIITTVFEPASEPVEPFTLRVKKLPDDIYNYRVFLLPHKLRGSREEKAKYISWIESQQKKIKMSDSAKSWFMNTDWNWDPRYILVDQESTLLMLKLRNPEIVGRVYRFVTG